MLEGVTVLYVDLHGHGSRRKSLRRRAVLRSALAAVAVPCFPSSLPTSHTTSSMSAPNGSPTPPHPLPTSSDFLPSCSSPSSYGRVSTAPLQPTTSPPASRPTTSSSWVSAVIPITAVAPLAPTPAGAPSSPPRVNGRPQSVHLPTPAAQQLQHSMNDCLNQLVGSATSLYSIERGVERMEKGFERMEKGFEALRDEIRTDREARERERKAEMEAFRKEIREAVKEGIKEGVEQAVKAIEEGR
ncbi:hypothetical protein JCM6882_006405 [Rhodosporidiobolus microsporus]